MSDLKQIKLRFLDSFRFMAKSLDSLASNLSEFLHIDLNFVDKTDFERNLLKRKCKFPYEYITDIKKLDETQLPPIENFVSLLSGAGITTEEYTHAQTVWNQFGCKNLGDYSDLYLKVDVLLLADIITAFRNTCYRVYNLDPAHYFTSPGLTWDAMLKHTKIKLELLTDFSMLNFIQKGIRGGISQCSHRYAKANNPLVPDFNSAAPITWLMYLDACNLYGYAMLQPLPISGFQWVDNITDFDVTKIADDAEEGYFLDIDASYPEHLHNAHNDLPFLVETRQPPGNEKGEKLLATFLDKINYVIHYRNLKQAIKHGIIIKKINRVLKFKQSAWLKSYIELNTLLRQLATNDFERAFFKLMINAIFGKTLENVMKRIDVKLKTHWENIGRRKGAASLIASTRFKNCTVFSEHLVAIQLRKTKVFYNKPIYVGFSVLEISKLHMYDFFYDFIKVYFPNEMSKLCYMDTDSLTLLLRSENIYNFIKTHSDYFDTSNYSEDNKFGILRRNKAVPGIFKDEYGGKVLQEFIGFRSKMYCHKVVGDKDKKVVKGIRKIVLNNSISFNDFKECLLKTNVVIYVTQVLFHSIKHEMFTTLQNKVCLSAYDNKRFVAEDGIRTYAWGHKNL